MTWRLMALAAVLSCTLVVPTAAQDVVPDAAQDAVPDAAHDNVDVNKLPVNLARIQRQLQQATARENANGLNLSFFVDVYGRAPRIELWAQEPNLMTGPAPYGAPTHRQIIEQITPQEYRAPAADFSALFRWLADKAKDKK
jgi:hypothetical protein